MLPNEDVDGNGQSLTMPLRMPGQYFDREVGLFYNYFRDYDPATGRYVESDPERGNSEALLRPSARRRL